MTTRGEVLNHSLSEVRISPDGESVQMFLTDTLPPYDTVVLLCKNVLMLNWRRTGDDSAPYFLGEATWQALESAEPLQALSRFGYPFFDEEGRVLVPNWESVIHLHFEGSACGDILCRSCAVLEEEHLIVLEQRLAASEADPEAGIPWEEAKTRLLEKQ